MTSPAGFSPTWRQPVPPPSAVAARDRRRRTLRNVLLLVLPLIVAAVIGVFYYFRPLPRPYFLPMWVTEYQARQLPFLPRTLQDREAMRLGNYFVRTNTEGYTLQEKFPLTQELDALAGLQAKDTVVIYLSGYARTDAQGEVQFMPADTRPEDPGSLLPFKTILEKLKACPAQGKLLVLDVFWPLADPRLGILTNDVADRIDATLEAVPDPNRLILCSCAPGQQPLASEEMGRTVFHYYFEEGLRGWAELASGQSERNGQVSAKEVALFVAARVDRWARHNRGTAQLPRLIGQGPDFLLTVLEGGEPKPILEMGPPDPYPAWLRERWRQYDQLLADNAYFRAPRFTVQFAATLQEAERDWRSGVEANRSRVNRTTQLDRLAEKITAVTNLPRPDPRSLAMAWHQGQRPEDAVTNALTELLTKIDAAATTGKPEEAAAAVANLSREFLEKHRGKPPFVMAYPVFELAAADPRPTPDRIRLLDRLLRPTEPQARFDETVILRRMALLADQVGAQGWPATTVHRALRTVRLAERATALPEAFPWIRQRAEEAGGLRRQGEAFLFNPGYASPEEADRWYRRAEDAFETILQQAEVVIKARQTLDLTVGIVPNVLEALEERPDLERPWLAAIEAGLALHQELQRTRDTREGAAPAALVELTARLEGNLDDLRRPFSPAEAQRAVQRSKQETADGQVVQELNALLTVPLLRGESRLDVAKARTDLARRLHQATLTEDVAEGRVRSLDQLAAEVDRDRGRLRDEERARAARRARTALALLKAAGLAPERLAVVEVALARAASAGDAATAWQPLGAALRDAFEKDLPAQLERTKDLAARDRLGRFIGPFEPSTVLDDPQTNPAVVMHRHEARQTWAWLADWYDYEAADFPEIPFFAVASRELQQFAPLPPPLTVHFTGAAAGAVIDRGETGTVYHADLQIATPDGKPPQVEIRVIQPNEEWLELTPDLADLPRLQATTGGARTCSVPVRVRVRPGAERSGAPLPRGFILQARVNGRYFHHLVPLTFRAAPDPIDVLISANPEQPTDPVGEIRLRPAKVKQAFYVYLRNASGKPRDVLVQLQANGRPPLVGKAHLEPGKPQLINFAPAAPAPATAPAAAPVPAPATPAAPTAEPELPELKGPVVVRVLAAEPPNAVLEERVIPVGVASPREYLRVTDVQYQPAGPLNNPKSRLTVKVKAPRPLPGGPCPVELVIPRDRNPDLLAVGAGFFRGELLGQDELTLYAEDLQFKPGSGEEGWAYLHCDGRERTFIYQVTFARRGEPTVPQEAFSPDLHLAAPRRAPANPKFPVTLEVDHAPNGAKLDLSLGQGTGDGFTAEMTRPLPDARRRRIGYQPPAGDGALTFEATDQDWREQLNLGQVLGTHTIRARLQIPGGQTLVAEQVLEVYSGEGTRYAVEGVPRRVKPGAKIPVWAVAKTPVSRKIETVRFFLGKPADNKLPPNTAVYRATADNPGNPANNRWAGVVPVPMDHRGPVDVSVEVINDLGESSFATATAELDTPLPPDPTPPPKPPAPPEQPKPPEPGSIKGTVMEGPRPQAGLTVYLLDDKNMVKDKKATDADGKFVFEKVPAGSYKLYVTKESSRRKANPEVKVEAGKPTEVTVELSL